MVCIADLLIGLAHTYVMLSRLIVGTRRVTKNRAELEFYLTATRFLRGFIASDAGGSANQTPSRWAHGTLGFGSQLHSQQSAWGGTPWAYTLGP